MKPPFPEYLEIPYALDEARAYAPDDTDRYPPGLVRAFLEHYTKPGDKVFDPFLGFGTTAFVAEEMDRIPYGIEADGERYEWAAGQLEHWMNILHADSGDIAEFKLPRMDFCITSPPFMPLHHKWNPLYGGDPAYAGYDKYMARMAEIFAAVGSVMKRGAYVAVHCDNLAGKVFTPLVRDIGNAVSQSFKAEGETIIRWQGARPDYPYTHCLIFRKT